MMMSITLRLRHAGVGCPGTSLAASPQHRASAGGTCLGSPRQIAKHTPHVQEGPLQAPTGRHCRLCPSSNVQCVYCTGGFVARMGWAAEPEICANAAPPRNPPHGQDFHMGKEGVGGRERCQQPHPSPSGQRVIRRARGFRLKHTLKSFVRNSVPLTVWAAAQLSQSKLSGKMPSSPCVGSKLFLRDILQGLFTRITSILPFHWFFAVIITIIHFSLEAQPPEPLKDKATPGSERHIWRRLPSRTFSVPERSQEHGGARADKNCVWLGFNWPNADVVSCSRHHELTL